MSEPILKVENMNKRFGSTVALKDVSLSVYPGEIRGLIGENGSGKSTITSIVAGMQACDSGKMIFKNQDWKPLSMIDALHKGIGMIVQESGTIPGITVAENIFLAETERYKNRFATVYKGNIIKNLIMDCQSYTKYRPNETTGGIFVSWRRKEELPTGA